MDDSRRSFFVAAVGFAVVAVVSTLIATPAQMAAQPKFSDWSAPVNLGPLVNSPFNEAGPALSKNGLSLYFHSNRPGGLGGSDIWVSQRNSPGESWGPPINIRSSTRLLMRLLPTCPVMGTGFSS
jgi:WD40-like Beta Propeller Repeat